MRREYAACVLQYAFAAVSCGRRFVIAGCALLLLSSALYAAPVDEKEVAQAIDALQAPMYNAFTERYLLDEVKSLRTELLNVRAEMIEKMTTREMSLASRSISYVSDSVTYFFYLIAGTTSILLLVGWNSVREIKSSAYKMAQEQITQLIEQYETRLDALERQLRSKSSVIDENIAEIERTQEMHALWLRARQAGSPLAQIDVYDQILALRPGDAEALTYKADAALAMDSPEWAVNLCQSALRSDPDYGYAHYQMACAYSRMQQIEDALAHLQAALERNESYQSLAREEEDFQNLREHAEFQRLLSRLDIEVDAAGT